jgi:hypothetical protein
MKAIIGILILVTLSSCATTHKGYDYKSHHKRSANAKPSKCYVKHNSNW